jgi:hypothetical protein
MEKSEKTNNPAHKVSQGKRFADFTIEAKNKMELLGEFQTFLDSIPGNMVDANLRIKGLIYSPKVYINMDLKRENPIVINIGSLVDKVEITAHPSASENQLKNLQDKVRQTLLEVLNNADKICGHSKADPKECLRIENNKLTCSIGCDKDCYLRKLEYHKDTSVGLWCFDQDPKMLDLGWIRTHAFRLTFGNVL